MRYRHLSPMPILTTAVASVAVCSIFFLSLSGCAPRTNYRILSFFFDGVPDPDRKEVQLQGTGTANAPVARPAYKEHGPYAAKLCVACHQRGTNVLILPVEKLCYNCHIIQTDKKYIHGPVASGGCQICHDPHGSGFPFLLVSEPRKFCFHCHSEKDVGRNPVHAGVTGECTQCHDAHKSDDRNLLKGT